MPKQKITKEMVVDAAFTLARKDGLEAVMVKNIAHALNCSVQPIYSYCRNMEGLRQDVMEKVSQFINAYMTEHIDKNDLFRSSGQAYVQLAKAEPHLFKLFILHQRTNISSMEALYQSEANPLMAEYIANDLHIELAQAKQLHLHMLIYTIGLGTIYAVTDPGITADEIFVQQELAYEAFLKQVVHN